MKSLKRVLALAVVFAMVLGCIPAMAATFSDVAEADQESVSVLTQLSIIQGYNEDGEMLFKGEQTITRAEFAAVVCRMIGMEEVSKSQTPTIFSDVPATHWASGYIMTAVGQGIIVGMGNGTFEPETPVTYEQAIKMIVCAMGYEPMAAEQGGYPTGYLFVAQTIGLLDGVVGRVGEEASRSIVAQLCYNALDIPLMQSITFGSSSKQYGIFDGTEFTPRKTLMSESLNVVKLAGTVTANENTSNNTLKEGIVTIKISDNYGSKYATSDQRYLINASTDFKVGETNAKDFIGHNVVVFVKHETNRSLDPTIISIAENTSFSRKLTVSLDNLKSATEITNDNTNILVEYYTDKVNGKSNKIYLPKGAIATFINGISQQSYTGLDLISNIGAGNAYEDKLGEIQFVSTKTTGTADYDTIFITVYQNFVVDYVDEISYKIYASSDSPSSILYLSFDPEERDIKTTIVDKDGAAVDPQELQEWDVLSVKSNDPFNNDSNLSREIYECTLIRNTITGKVTEKTYDNPPKFGVDGTLYKIDPDAEGTLNLEVDYAGTFYLDILGRIVAFNVGSDGSGTTNYALYINSIKNDFSGYRVKLYTAEGNMIIKDLATRVRWMEESAGTYRSSQKEAKDVFAAINNVKEGEICSYKTNSNGEISTLAFSTASLKPAAGNTMNYNQAADKANALTTNANAVAGATILAKNLESKRIRVGTRTFDVANNAKVIVGYQSKDAAGNLLTWANSSDSNFDTWNLDSISDDQTIPATMRVSVYDVDAFNAASLIFINGDASIENATTGVALIKSKSQGINAEGVNVDKFRIVSNTNDPVVDTSTNTKEFTLSEDSNASADSVAIGSIVLAASRNNLDEVKKLDVLTAQTGLGNRFVKTADLDAKAAAGGDVEYYFGTITDKNSNTIFFVNEFTGLEESRVISNSTKVMVYDQRLSIPVVEKTIGEVQFDKYGDISAKDVAGYDVFIRVYQGKVEDVVLYIYNKPIITFVDENGAVISRMLLSNLVVPAVPAKAGFTAAWEITNFANVKTDMTVKPVYTAIP